MSTLPHSAESTKRIHPTLGPYLATLTPVQLCRLADRLRDRAHREFAGGFGWSTLWAANPGLAEAIETVNLHITRIAPHRVEA